MEIYIHLNYTYHGKQYNELTLSQSYEQQDKQEVVLKNELCEEMFRSSNFFMLTRYIEELKAGVYANEKEE